MPDINTAPLRIDCALAPQINFACHQNAVPLIRNLSITNPSSQDVTDLRLSMEASPGFVTPKIWNIDRLPAGGTTHITDRDTRLDGQFLLGLQEAMHGSLTLTLQQGDKPLAHHEHQLEVLARNQWGGYGSSPELLVAFVMPNDAAVERLLHTASKVLRGAGLPPEFDGYHAHSRKRVWEQASAIWAVVARLGLDYAYPPASFEKTGQKVRTPSMIFEVNRATCLDTTLLFCAALEQAGLNSVMVIKNGHAFAGVWLQPEGFGHILTDDVVAIRKRIDLKELVLFETTLATQTPRVSFNEAVKQGRMQVGEKEAEDFQYLLDLSQARAKRIRPLDYAQTGERKAEDSPAAEGSVPMEAAPEDLPDFQREEPQEVPTTPRGRLDQWQRKLLDLSLRNPLLNFRAPKASLPIIAPDPAALEDRLADGAEMQIQPLPAFTSRDGRDAQLHQQRTGEQLDEEYAREGLQHNRIYVRMEEKQLEAHLIALYRKAKNDLEEGGANTLFLAIGFLRWQREDKGDRIFRAPLILVPIEIKRQSVRSGIKIKLHDDEPRFNTTLLEMLRQDFALDISGLDGPLPSDDSGIDVAGIWNRIKQEVRDVKGFEVTEEIVLGMFSFAKYLMWKDLVDRTDHLRENPVVRHLLETPQQAYVSDAPFADPTTLDDTYPPAEIFTPLDTDSSQLAAIVASAQGKDFVMIGPPGTGKSQTIANMIAQNLAIGRSVLFVSEKAAALNVVYRRLKAVGLGEFCLELHSNKARKLEVLEQLRRAWETRENLPAETWTNKAEHLRVTRDHLNRYVRRLHKIHGNGWSIHQALGQIVSNPDVPDMTFDWPSPDYHDRPAFERLLEVARRIDINAGEIGDIVHHPLGMVHASDWSLAWQQELLATLRSLGAAAAALKRSVDALAETLTIAFGKLTIQQLGHLINLCQALMEAEGQSLAFAFSGQAKAILATGDNAMELLAQYRDREKGLSCAYADQAWRQLDLGNLTTTWREAGKQWWPKSALWRSRVRKALRQKGHASGKPAPDQDLKILIELATLGKQLDAGENLLCQIEDWRGFDTDLPRLRQAIDIAHALREATAGLARTPDDLGTLRRKIHAVVVEANDMLDAEGVVGQALARIRKNAASFHEYVDRCTKLAGDWIGNHLEDGADCLLAIGRQCEDVEAHHAHLNSWCAWRRARNEADDLGVSALVHALEDGMVKTGDAERSFKVAYCRWWATKMFDADDILRQFVSAEHEARIQDFRQLDDELRRLTAQYVRARLCGQMPEQGDVTRRSEFGILKRELEKKRRHKPLRQLITELPTALPQLTPCLLMSPLSIAQYLPVDHQSFDVVIFDEASQINVYDAIGAIARGRQTIVAGDPKQLPPTNFFARQVDEDEFDCQEADLESILDEMHAARIPKLGLTWHYRSKNENLITFSNHRYYNSSLITFPAATTADDSVQFRFVEGIYQRGGNRTNRAEAEAIVEEIVARLQPDYGVDEDGQDATPSMGVVTFNSEQQTLIENLLDEALRSHPGIEAYFGENTLEPVFVKNLESVQGDERDVILFSITYGPDMTGRFSMNFGPLNQDGGERRLNVAVTRARCEMMVFSSIRSDQIDLSRTQALGVTDLKHFLEFAERGPKALSEATFGPGGDFDSPLEAAVARELRQRGWQVHPQVGVSTFRIDLGIVHPDTPGRYLAGVECDGATYHRVKTARDRDKVRESILKRLGWNILRLWSTDFWLNPAGAVDKLDAALHALLEQDREEAVRKEATAERPEQIENPSVSEGEAIPEKPAGQELEKPVETVEKSTPPGMLAGPAPITATEPIAETYCMIKPTDVAMPLHSEKFYEAGYAPVLDDLIDLIVTTEGPILDDNLAKRITTAHGFKRAGRRIQELVLKRARRNYATTSEDVGAFFWPKGIDPDRWQGCRRPQTSADFRAPNEIPMQELTALAAECRFEQDPPVAMARELGIARLSTLHRERLTQALEKVLEQ